MRLFLILLFMTQTLLAEPSICALTRDKSFRQERLKIYRASIVEFTTKEMGWSEANAVAKAEEVIQLINGRLNSKDANSAGQTWYNPDSDVFFVVNGSIGGILEPTSLNQYRRIDWITDTFVPFVMKRLEATPAAFGKL